MLPHREQRMCRFLKVIQVGQRTVHHRWVSSISGDFTDLVQTPTDAYRVRMQKGNIIKDEYQLRVLRQMDLLQESLQNYHPPLNEGPMDWKMGKFFGKVLSKISRQRKSNVTIPRGMYIHGAVGGGKVCIAFRVFNLEQFYSIQLIVDNAHGSLLFRLTH